MGMNILEKSPCTYLYKRVTCIVNIIGITILGLGILMPTFNMSGMTLMTIKFKTLSGIF